MTNPSLKKTPLHLKHQEHGAKLIDFGGWDMPIQYKEGIKKEHQCVREAAGLFDVSHMGQVSLHGKAASSATQTLITGNAETMTVGDALYTLMCLPTGGIIDDCIVYRRAEDDFLIIVNAANHEKDLNWINEHRGDATVVDESEATGLIAVQGPNAVSLCTKIADSDLSQVPRFQFAMSTLAGVSCMVARTGYTGEDGFEIACPSDKAASLWDALMDAGQSAGAKPIGLGARDTLRLEAKLSLYGNDIDESTTPYEAALGWAVKLDSGDFIGHSALAKQKAEGLSRKLVGFKIEGRGIPRSGYDIIDRDLSPIKIGHVTSGNVGITVGGAVGMGYVPLSHSKIGQLLTIDVRGKDISAEIVKGPFYKRQS